MKYHFKSALNSAEDLLKAIGKTDIPSTDICIRQPAIDEETGESIADIEVDFGRHKLTLSDENKLKATLKEMGFTKPLREENVKA